MAIVKAVSSKASIKTAIEYVTKDEKTEDKLISGLNCSPDNAYDEMQTTKEMWGKTEGRTYKHFVQSYHPDDNITPEQAHKNAMELAEQTEAFKGHEVLIATHIDKDHIHSHIIVNSVNAEDGHKLQWSKKDLARMKELSNKQSREQGLHVPEKGKTFEGKDREETSAYTKEAYQQLKKAESEEVQSYIQDIALKVLQARETSQSKEDFIKSLDEMGISVDWQENHKYITFTDKAREEHGEKKCKIRGNKLENYYNADFTKEGLLNEFERNKQATESRSFAIEEAARTIAEAEPSIDRAEQEVRTSPPIEQRINARRIERVEETSRIGQEYSDTNTREQRTIEEEASGIRAEQSNINNKIEKARSRAEQGFRAIEQLQRILEEPEQEQGIERELQAEIRILEESARAISEVARGIEETSRTCSSWRKEQSDINTQSESTRGAITDLKNAKPERNPIEQFRSRFEGIRERIKGIGEAHRGIKASLENCFRKQSDIGRRIEQARSRAIEKVVRRGKGR